MPTVIPRLWGRDQFGTEYGPLNQGAPRQSILDQAERKTATPMYIDRKDGSSHQIGYVLKPTKGSFEFELWVEFYWTFGWEKGRQRPTITEESCTTTRVKDKADSATSSPPSPPPTEPSPAT